MKKIIISAIIFLSLTNLVKAQDNSNQTDFRNEIRFGLRTGLNVSNVYDTEKDTFSADGKFGFVGGAFLSMPIGKYLGVQPEFLFSQKGFKGSGSLLGASYSFSRTTSYIDIPLQIAVKPSEFFTLLAGPQYSYLVKQKDVFTNSTSVYIQEQGFNNDNIRKNIFGFVAGLDINMKHFVLSGRLNWDLSKNNGDGSSSALRYKNKWYQLSIGYCF